MRTSFFAIAALLACNTSMAQPYQADWESLDKRPTPQWFKDAKFGIFIHWGVYAVPGWSSKGQYAEWYQYGLQTTDTPRMQFHRRKFGNRTYYDLAGDFKAELYKPDEWAKLFEQSGARYIVLTSKHHDGYALWPSKEASSTWGFPWNAVETGPQRDLLGDLFKAVRKTNVRAGMYYSLYEWFNPLWKSDPQKFVDTHTWPQMKDLINTYQPDVFWTDGDWDAPAETWRSQEFIAWLYNESPVKDRIVVNDRWGSGVRFHHGGIYTPEYQPDLGFDDHYWEESRGIGASYGYNREEDAWDYNSTASLVLQLIDKVSRGGNFLLDIGPDAHGKIPPIMQERLLQMGEWLKVNGEAIYGTTRWKQSSQQQGGKRTVYYTYHEQRNALYALFPQYPSDKKLQLKNITLPAGTSLQLLPAGQPLTWRQEGVNVVADLPDYDPNVFTAPYAYAIKISNYGRYAARPAIHVTYPQGGLTPLVSMAGSASSEIYYTTGGTEPGKTSRLYTAPFSLPASATVKAIAYSKTDAVELPSSITAQEVTKYEWMKAVNAPQAKPGIAYKYYEPSGKIDMSVVNTSPVADSGTVKNISVNSKKRADRFAFVFEGYVKAPADGVYQFFTTSDDGSRLFIDGMEVVNNDGDHGSQQKSGKAYLRKGFHRLRVTYFDSGGGNELKVHWQAAGGKKEELPAAVLFH